MSKKGKSRRVYDEDFKAEAVRMLLDGHSAGSVASRLGVSCPTTIRRWKQQHLEAAESWKNSKAWTSIVAASAYQNS